MFDKKEKIITTSGGATLDQMGSLDPIFFFKKDNWCKDQVLLGYYPIGHTSSKVGYKAK